MKSYSTVEIELLAEVMNLREINHQLRAELQFLRGNPAIAKGLQGESLIAQLLSGKTARPGANYDVEASNGLTHIEVKYSSLLKVMEARPIKRWVWTKLFGELGNKKYDRLLLIGDADHRFAKTYSDPTSPYVIFDLPYSDAIEIAGGIQSGRTSRIQLTTNPKTVTSKRSQILFEKYQVPIFELQQRYPTLKSIHNIISIN
jgi:hypothetical protein